MKKINFTNIAKDVIQKEIDGLKKLKSSIGNSFDQIIKTILGCKSGKVIISGAVHSSELVRVFREVEKAGIGAPDTVFADTLKIPNHMRQSTLPPPEKDFTTRPASF